MKVNQLPIGTSELLLIPPVISSELVLTISGASGSASKLGAAADAAIAVSISNVNRALSSGRDIDILVSSSDAPSEDLDKSII